MKKTVRLVLLTTLVAACTTVPITGRKQLSLMPESQLISMSLTQYKSFLEENTVVDTYDDQAKLVKKVGQKIAKACEEFLAEKGQSKRVAGFDWEFNLVDENMVNAWCMPGGKVVVYTGIMPVCKDEEGLATVMSHEIAHAVARHGNERMSQQMAVAGVGVGLAIATHEKPALTRDLFLMSYGVGSQLGVLAFSRSHESEADKMGLVFMERAGYNSESAIGFWQRMSQLGGGQKPPQLLSTHPSDETRIRDIKEFIPIAKSYKK